MRINETLKLVAPFIQASHPCHDYLLLFQALREIRQQPHLWYMLLSISLTLAAESPFSLRDLGSTLETSYVH